AEAIKRVTGQCGLASVFYKPVGQLSKGFRQRVGLAQALIHEPTVLILDEPTVGLDPKQIMEIRELIKKLGKDRTVLLSTHILQEVQAICDKVTIIHKGKIVASDTPEKLQQKTEEEITGSIYAKISGSIKEVEEVLRQIPGVKKVSKQDTEKKNLYGYMISCDQGVDVRSEIVTTVASHNLKLYELTPQKATLENVFLELTK
ncbi:MAG TPA: ATP-binding cassette domain-containing protein, partial [bacterium]|nr:ATP-binding cassette domain-containing protein [bacterium]